MLVSASPKPSRSKHYLSDFCSFLVCSKHSFSLESAFLLTILSVYCAEIFPTWMRAQGVGFSVMGLFASTLVYTQAAPVAFADIGWKYYLGIYITPYSIVRSLTNGEVFIIVPLCGVWIVAFILPETKGLALEEIGALFGDEVALDISHLSLEEREALDRSLTRVGSSEKSTGHPSSEQVESVV